MKFPQDRVGPPSDVGRTMARVLDRARMPYALAEPEDGVFAYKKNGWLEVENVRDVVRTLLFIGTDNDVWTSKNSGTDFTLLPVAAPPTTSTSSLLTPIGNGQGLRIGSPTQIGFTTDIAGNDAPVASWPYYWTADAQTWTLLAQPLTFGTAFGNRGIVYDGRIAKTKGAYANGEYSTSFALDYRNPEDIREYRTIFLRDNGVTQFVSTVFEQKGKIVRMVGFERIAPQTFLVLTAGFVPGQVVDLSYDPINTPTLDLHLSTDNGVSWRRIGVPSSMKPDMDAWQAIHDRGGVSDILMGLSVMSCAPLDSSTTLVSLYYPNLLSFGIYGLSVVKFKVDRYSGSFTDIEKKDFNSGTASDPDYARKAFPYFERGLIGVKGGVLIMRGSGDETNYNTMPISIGFSADGNEPVLSTMPFVAAHTGIPVEVAPGQLLCSMFDGVYSLYQSRDNGASWTRRSTISPDTTPPIIPPSTATVFRYSEMDRYTAIAYLRADGVAVNATPSTPWISDDRIPPL